MTSHVLATTTFREVFFTQEGHPEKEIWRAQTPTGSQSSYLGESDVILATGGAKGITAECALALAKHSHAALALLGRAPATDSQVRATLQRAEALGLKHVYLRADVGKIDEVTSAIAQAERELGPITAVIHGAGRNEPRGALDLSLSDFEETVRPKVEGLAHVLTNVDSDHLRLLVPFASIIGRAGLQGEAHYATANAWLTDMALAFARTRPHVRVRAIEWSGWSGAGMGERLGVVETLRRQGIDPIPTQWGTDLFLDLVDDPEVPPVVVAASRTGELPTFELAHREIPLGRFLENVPLHYPGIEMMSEATLSVGKDRYLVDHALDGDLLFPAVMGLEAMAQVAVALQPSLGDGLAFADVTFERPIVVPRDGELTIRLVALVGSDGLTVAIRTSDTGYAVDHFRALVTHAPRDQESVMVPDSVGLHRLSLDPARDMYGHILFQGRRFQRLTGYRVATARRAVAELTREPSQGWFSPFLPQKLVLADPGARDALMHSLQCCVPHATLLPEGVDLIVPTMAKDDQGPLLMEAQETLHSGDVYTYTATCFHESGSAAERWEGLRLHAVRHRDPNEMRWVPALAASFLHRDAQAEFTQEMTVSVEPHPAGGEEGRRGFQRMTQWALNRLNPGVSVTRKSNGALLLNTGQTACSAHHDRFTLAVLGEGPLACDTEAVVARGESTWASLLGQDLELARQISQTMSCTLDEAATCVWGAMECVRKAGHQHAALSLAGVKEGRVVLRAGAYTILTWLLHLHGDNAKTMFAILGGQ